MHDIGPPPACMATMLTFMFNIMGKNTSELLISTQQVALI